MLILELSSGTFSVPGNHFDYMLRSNLRHMCVLITRISSMMKLINSLVDGKGRPVPFPVSAPRDDSQAGALRHGKQTADPGASDAVASLSHKPGEPLS